LKTFAVGVLSEIVMLSLRRTVIQTRQLNYEGKYLYFVMTNHSHSSHLDLMKTVGNYQTDGGYFVANMGGNYHFHPHYHYLAIRVVITVALQERLIQ
jgi:hypothetical protein